MNWLVEKVEAIKKAYGEIEKSELSNDTKAIVLKILKEELELLDAQYKKINSDKEYVEGGFGK